MSSIAELSFFKEPDFQKVQIFLLDSVSDWPENGLGAMPAWLSPEKSDSTQVSVLGMADRQVVVVFLQNQKEESCRKAGAEAVGILKKWKATEGKIWSNVGNSDLILAFCEGALLASYRFDKYKSEKARGLKKLEIWHPFLEKKQIKNLNILVDAVSTTRNLVNEPASTLTAKKLSDAFEKAGKESGFEVEVLGKNKIQSLKMGGLLGVNQGSDLPPTFNILEYKPKGAKNEKPIVLVGKGVVYDTGGHSLKTSAGMEAMKCDMAGAATVLGIFKAVAEMGLPIHLVGLVPATDNRISAAALSPGDVITMSDGSTVEVLNTDAEGRLILADALVFAKKYDPELVFDFATLTGAAARAIGKEGFVFMGTANEETKNQIRISGETVYERGVEFPIWDEYKDYLKSDVADLKNIGGADAGAITAGKFLQHFTLYPWLHFDIAGTSFFEGGAVGYLPKGGTGIGVRLIVDFLKSRIA
jgi:leucyl aminopeptidase